MAQRPPTIDPADTVLIDDDPSVELSSNRTSLSLERTRMSADRTLMATVRTSLSLIGFGFTIHETFKHLADSGVLQNGDTTGRKVGMSLLILGVVMLTAGIFTHTNFSRQLTLRRERLVNCGLIHRAVQYSATPTLIGAVLLLVIGLGALASTVIQLTS